LKKKLCVHSNCLTHQKKGSFWRKNKKKPGGGGAAPPPPAAVPLGHSKMLASMQFTWLDIILTRNVVLYFIFGVDIMVLLKMRSSLTYNFVHFFTHYL